MCAPRVTRHTSIRYSSSSAVNVRPLDFCWHRHSVSVNCLYHARMVLCVGGSFAYFARNARCTVPTDLLVWYSNTQHDFYPGADIFSLHTLASPSGRNVNYDEKQLTGGKIFLSCSFYLYRFRKYVSYRFPIINFCNPGVHYEKPPIWEQDIITNCFLDKADNENPWKSRSSTEPNPPCSFFQQIINSEYLKKRESSPTATHRSFRKAQVTRGKKKKKRKSTFDRKLVLITQNWGVKK